jgi:lysophospholipase L1-like esterase
MNSVSSPAPKSTPVTPIYCIGDSHVCLFSGQDAIQPGWPARSYDLLPFFITHHLGGVLAYNLPRCGTKSLGRENLFASLQKDVPAGSRVLLSFGEIDCRAHLIKQATNRNLPIETVVAECLDNYFQVVREVQALGYSVIIYNAVPSAIWRTRRTRREDDYIAVGNWQVRNAAIHAFNAGAKRHCASYEAKFLDTAPAFVNPAGKAVSWYYFDAIHLSQRALPLTLRALAKLFPAAGYPELPLPQPTWGQKLFDRAIKRTRRWLKLAPPRSAN